MSSLDFVDNAAYGFHEVDSALLTASKMTAERMISIRETNYRRDISIPVTGDMSIGLLTHAVVEAMGKSICPHQLLHDSFGRFFRPPRRYSVSDLIGSVFQG